MRNGRDLMGCPDPEACQHPGGAATIFCRPAIRLPALVLAGSMAAAMPSLAGEAPCPLAAQQPMRVAELFFGRDIVGRAPVSESEWSVFVARQIARQFPDGFTVQDGRGEWLGKRGVVRERTKILTVAAPPTAALSGKLSVVIDAYRRQFHQTSVGVLTYEACGAF